MDRRVVWITGGSAGIGRAIALTMSRAGWDVGVGSRRIEELESPARSVPERIVAAPLDVRSADSVAQWVESLRKELGVPDAVVASAGWGIFASIEDTGEALWNRTIDTNLKGLYLVTKAVLPAMLARGRGQFVHILSVASRIAFPDNAAYCASKYGALGFTEALRAEVRARGIRVTAVLPGATDTPFWDRQEGKWDRSKMIPVSAVAQAVRNLLEADPTAWIEEIRLTPPSGNL